MNGRIELVIHLIDKSFVLVIYDFEGYLALITRGSLKNHPAN